MNPCPLILIRKLPPPPPSLASISLFNPFPEFSTPKKADRRAGKNSLGNGKIKGLLKKEKKFGFVRCSTVATLKKLQFERFISLYPSSTFIHSQEELFSGAVATEQQLRSFKRACNKRHSPHSFLPTQFYDFLGMGGGGERVN